jgi:hypothetical protein
MWSDSRDQDVPGLECYRVKQNVEVSARGDYAVGPERVRARDSLPDEVDLERRSLSDVRRFAVYTIAADPT